MRRLTINEIIMLLQIYVQGIVAYDEIYDELIEWNMVEPLSNVYTKGLTHGVKVVHTTEAGTKLVQKIIMTCIL